MITFLSGGTGTPKLLRGIQEILDEREISVVVNTAEDMWLTGNHLSPDIDTVLYLFAETLDTTKWWGIRGDTFITHEYLQQLGVDEFIAVGDLDRAVHAARGEQLPFGHDPDRLDKGARRASRRAGDGPSDDRFGSDDVRRDRR